MKPFEAITTVYSYYLPEVRDLVDDITRVYPHNVFLRSVKPGLDDFHQPILEKLVDLHREDVPGLAQFPHSYPTSGTEEGIREYMTLLQSRGVERIYFWEGEYEGYREVARSRGIEARPVPIAADPGTLDPGYWFFSNPSARDGMIVPEERIHAVLEAGHKVFYDLAYLGATGPYIFDLSHPNIDAAVVSFSKTYGLFYYRIGFTFCREQIPALYANKWFKNIFSLLLAEAVLDRVDLPALAAKYKHLQAAVVEQINTQHNLGLTASDAFLLAHLPLADAVKLRAVQQELIQPFRRGTGYRFCLTPYFLLAEE